MYDRRAPNNCCIAGTAVHRREELEVSARLQGLGLDPAWLEVASALVALERDLATAALKVLFTSPVHTYAAVSSRFSHCMEVTMHDL